MKVSDYVATFLRDQGVTKVFGVTGGASIHLLHSFQDVAGIDAVFTHHEQAASMAADGYARAIGPFGCAVATSGPGATNLVTGIVGAWVDSIAVLHLTGQVATYRMGGSLGVRQYGFQETDFVGMVAGVTKYATVVRNPLDVRYELEKAVTMMMAGRPGPAVIDLPDDIQRLSIEPDELRSFWLEQQAPVDSQLAQEVHSFVRGSLSLLKNSERPVLILGAGATSGAARSLVRQFAARWPMPILTTWRAKDVTVDDDGLVLGTFGTHGNRAGNFAVQNADLVLALGTRLSTKETGTPMSSFARGARLLMVDLDAAEIAKFSSLGRPVELGVQASVESVLSEFMSTEALPIEANWMHWRQRVTGWRTTYPPGDKAVRATELGTVDPYLFVHSLSGSIPDGEHLFVDTGCAVTWIMQAFEVRNDQRVHHDCNNTAMGWAIPAAIGGSIGLLRPVTCVVGDGSFMMNLQELATAAHHELPIAIFLLNNAGYGMVRQTEDQWLDGINVGTGLNSAGLSFPSFGSLCESFGIEWIVARSQAELDDCIGQVYEERRLMVIEVMIDPHAGVSPQCKFGFPIEDADPPLSRDEFLANMTITPTPASLGRLRPDSA